MEPSRFPHLFHFSLCLALTLWPTALVAQGVPGDANGDGRYGAADIPAVIQHVLENTTATGDPDCTGDGQIDVLDVACVVRLIEITVPAISDFNPKSGRPGTLITVTGQHLATPGGAPATVTLARQGGGTLAAPVTTATAASLTFALPAGAANGTVTVSLPERPSATSAASLTVLPSSDFTLSAAPPMARLIQGQSTSYTVTLESANGFARFAELGVSGLPAGVTATFVPSRITAGQTAVLDLGAAAGALLGTIALTITATAEVEGTTLAPSTLVDLEVEAVTTTFRGRTVVADALQTPLAGVTVTMLGIDDTGTSTGCSGQTISDAAGNFVLANLPAACAGGQLIRYDGDTVTAPPGSYAGVDLHYELTLGAVTSSPVLVHLPRVDNAETVWVEQNAAEDQHFVFQTIPDLEATVYAGTTLTLPDGGTPDPFPLIAVAVPVDRLPEEIPASSDTIDPFIVAFQPANAHASQPVAVTFPNLTATAPLTSVTLSTLDPAVGTMVVYGTGTISENGRQVIPDFDPAFPGRRYGIVNFDWHGPRIPPPPQVKPAPPDGPCPIGIKPIDPSSGIEILQETDLVLSGRRGSLSIDRTYRTLSTEAGPFGFGSNHNYGFRLDSNVPSFSTLINLILPDGNRVAFVRVGTSSVLRNTTVPTLADAVMTTSFGLASLRFADGTIFKFTSANAILGSVLESIIDREGNTILLVRDPSRPVRIDEIVDPVGRQLFLSYDGADRITQITDPIGRTVFYTYNAQGYLETMTDPMGGVTAYTYDVQNRLFQVFDARGVKVAENTYDSNGRAIQQIQGDGGVWLFDYTLANPLVPASPVVETRVTNPRGLTTTYRYNPQGYLLSVTDPLGQTRVFERELGTNRIVEIRGNVACGLCGGGQQGSEEFSYDATGKLVAYTGAGVTTTFTYDDAHGRITSVTDALGNSAQYSYDGFGRMTTSTDANGRTHTFRYDESGLLAGVDDALGHGIEVTYDAFGNPLQVTDALGATTTWVYDAVSRPAESIDALGRRSTIVYDALNRVISSTDGAGRETLFTYDEVGNLLSMADPRGLVTSFTYDARSRVITRTDSLGRSSTRTYDFNSNLTSFTDRRGQTSTFAYDEADRLVLESYEDASVVERVYDPSGRLVEVRDSAAGSFSYTYDDADRLTRAAGPHGVVEYTRDVLGRVTARQVSGQDPVSYDYGTGRDLDSVSLPQASISFTYDPRGQLARLERSNGIASDYSYDAVGRLTALTHSSVGQVLDSQAYGYDALGQRSAYTASTARPLAVEPALGIYDSQSNRLFQRDAVAYTYDEEGNRLSESSPSGTLTYTWDSRNRLASMTRANGEVHSFVYDFAGHMIEHTVEGNGDPRITTFVRDDLSNVIALAENSGESTTLLTGLNVDHHFAAVGNAGVRFALSDILNSTVGVVDETGALTGTVSYGPFGETATSGETYTHLFTGRLPVADDLYYYRARFYDAQAGSFLSEDPLGIMSGDLNGYRYVSNNPVNLVDPSGEFAVPLLAVGIVAVGGVINGSVNAIGAEDGQRLQAFGEGFTTGAVGTGATLVTAALTRQPTLAGVAGGVASNLTDQFLFDRGEPFNHDSLISDAIFSLVPNPIADRLGGAIKKLPGLKMHGRIPDIWRGRDFSELGKNSYRKLAQVALDKILGAALDVQSLGESLIDRIREILKKCGF